VRPNAIAGFSISAESTAAAAKVAAMAAQNWNGPKPYRDPMRTIIGMWTR
jgi:hypothetical protein